MATVNFAITADQVEKITEYLGYNPEIENSKGETVPNPETRKHYLYGKIKEYLKNSYKAQASKDGEVARLAALEQAEIDLKNLDMTE